MSGITILLLLIALIVVWMVLRHFNAVKRVEYYAVQGMSALPGYNNFLIGNAYSFAKYRKLQEANKGKSPMRIATSWICDELHPERGNDNYDPSRDPIVVQNFGGNIHLMVSDPEMVQDLLVKKNALYDKTGALHGVFSNLLGDSFLFSRADDVWKAKRKACSHAFYKDRMVHMLEVLKDKMNKNCQHWLSEIATSQTGKTEVDIY